MENTRNHKHPKAHSCISVNVYDRSKLLIQLGVNNIDLIALGPYRWLSSR